VYYSCLGSIVDLFIGYDIDESSVPYYDSSQNKSQILQEQNKGGQFLFVYLFW